ncbi:egl5, partial [Symbiodinium pilosum]
LGSPDNSTGLQKNATQDPYVWEPPAVAQTLLEDNSTRSASAHRYAGYATFATTTRYGDAKAAACGGMHTGQLTAGLPYYSVASAQSMWQGCCWCSGPGGGRGTAGLGCFSCAKGRFLHSAYGLKGHNLKALHKTGFASEEIVIVVADLCPHHGNERWCPQWPGQRNQYGAHNHLDFSHPPPGIDNHNFVFTPISCPHDLRQRYESLSRCVR